MELHNNIPLTLLLKVLYEIITIIVIIIKLIMIMITLDSNTNIQQYLKGRPLRLSL